MSIVSGNMKVIKTGAQYHEYLHELDFLMGKPVPLGTDESDRLELLTVLLEDYENKNYSIELPDPIDAIKFRMTEEGLVQADLIPYFGRASRVSEVLSGKRDLTLDMIRKLSVGLGISSEVLLGIAKDQNKEKEIDWSKFPDKEMLRRGWIRIFEGDSVKNKVQSYVEQNLFGAGQVAFKRTLKGESISSHRQYAIYAWLARVLQRSRDVRSRGEIGQYVEDEMSTTFLKELAQLSKFEDGPQRAVNLLAEKGIVVIIEPRLEKTLLDGAALKDNDGSPVIGMTLRYDKIDSFWFTLLHEVVHIWKHIKSNDQAIIDNLDASSEERQEAEANRLAREAFIPRIKWRRSRAYLSPSKKTVLSFACELGIHPAIIAGRVQHDKNNYTILYDLTNEKLSNTFKHDMGFLYEK